MDGKDDHALLPVWELDQAGARRAYEAEYGSLVRLATLLLGRQAMAEDVVQDVFARLIEQPPKILSEEAVGSYVRIAVLNRSRSKIRRLMLERKHLAASETPVSAQYPDHELRAALLELPIRQRQCVVLRFYEDRKVDDIAELLSISPGSVKTHLHRGLARLRQLIGEETS